MAKEISIKNINAYFLVYTSQFIVHISNFSNNTEVNFTFSAEAGSWTPQFARCYKEHNTGRQVQRLGARNKNASSS
jgi:hypothetical protein